VNRVPAVLEARKQSKIPKSPETCSLCGEEMGVDVTVMLTYSSVEGPYAKLSVRLHCPECQFMDSWTSQLANTGAFREIWAAAHRLQRLMEQRAGTAPQEWRKRRRGLRRKR
jgi:hypothetical protein